VPSTGLDDPVTLRFAFLVLEDHPYGREMLRILLGRGLQPGILIEEASPLADDERGKFLTRIAGEEIPPPVSDLVRGLAIRRHKVDDHNNGTCRELLKGFGPEVVVLGGTRIILPHIFNLPSRGTVNAHPGLLPWLRGSSSVAWALYKNLPVGSTIHFVDKGIDTGAIIARRQLPIQRGMNYERIVRQVLTLSGELMAETLERFEAGDVKAEAQGAAAGETLRVIPPELLEEAKAKLASECYSHFADQEEGHEPSKLSA
jgi:methionyl-tRNA formyltransferase